jgi:RNA polymerase primary sigma factor
MASKIEVTPQEHESSERNDNDTPSDNPLLDLSDAAVKELVHSAQQRGYITHEQINLLSNELDSEQVENLLAKFSEMGVNVVETAEATEEEIALAGPDEEPQDEGRELIDVAQKIPTKAGGQGADRPHR